MNGLKVSTKIKNRESLVKYQYSYYNVKRNDNFKHRGMTLRRNNTLFPSLNVTNKKDPYRSKGVLRHYHYRSYKKSGQGVVDTRIIPCIFQGCTTQLYIPWVYKTKD